MSGEATVMYLGTLKPARQSRRGPGWGDSKVKGGVRSATQGLSQWVMYDIYDMTIAYLPTAYIQVPRYDKVGKVR